MAQKPAPYKIMNHDMAKSAHKAGSQNFVLGITQLLIITLILSLGFGQLLRFDFYGLPIYLHDILVILSLGFLVPNFVMKYKVRNFVFSPFLYVFLLALAISSIRAITLYPLSSLLVPSLYLFRLLAYICLYLFIKQISIKIPKIYYWISGFTTLFIGLLQYFLLPDMRWAQYLGFDDHLSRLTMPHFDPSFTAIMLTLALLSLVKVAGKQSLITSFIYLFGILLTYTRSVWLSLIFTGLVFIKNKKIFFLAFLLLLLAIFALPKRFGEGTNLLRTYSISSRINSDLSYVRKYHWDLLIGRGMNTLILDAEPTIYDNHATGPNNSYLYLLVTTGIIGLIGWGGFMLTLYQKSASKPMLTFFFIASLFNNVMFYPFALLWVLLIEATVPTSA
jgi:hypothetical protein